MRLIPWCLALLCVQAQAGILLSASEAARREQLACQPTAILGVLECEQLAPPPRAPSNDPEIKAPDYVPNSGESIPVPQTEQPMLPVLDAIPTRTKAGSLTLAWDIWFGTAGLWWEVWDKDQLRYRGRDFTRRIKDAPPNTPPEQLIDGGMQSVQSGTFQIAKLEAGEHQFLIKLCNGSLEQPVCNEVAASTWTDASDGQDGAAAKPDAPALAWIPQVTTEGKVTVAWNLWWGNTGTHWEVLNGSKIVYRSDKFTENYDHSQAGQVDVPLANGAHSLSVRLCRELACSTSDTLKVDAMLGPELSPAKPQVALFTPDDPDLGDGLLPSQVLLSWKTDEPGIVPDRWMMIDQTTRQVLFSQPIKADCGSGVWCGSWQGVPPSRPATLRVKLCKAKSCTDSDLIEVPGVEVK
ncbi:hypothetical protein HQ393_04240 [Chitinibacter bivalviorum]|uniref:Chitinase A N-terminal domain-containing protein n=1 Tax=Chitinibacter bivalviorum TaxID=2739434 RepID=A0A7H9BFN2_9NEIS|nr:chitinase N-terminal domain-containing protein [Chitinibacter bivalviorum]QLG87523.1 hypothetical protein HQ393_04240 [Chitinibacter bivalviorum]